MKAQKKPIRNLALKIAIVASGHTARWVALRTGIGEVRLSAFVRGVLEPSDDEKRRLAKFLRQTQSALFHSSDEAIAS